MLKLGGFFTHAYKQTNQVIDIEISKSTTRILQRI